MYIYAILFSLIFILLLYILNLRNKIKRNKEDILKEEIENHKKELEEIYEVKNKELKENYTKLESDFHVRADNIEQLIKDKSSSAEREIQRIESNRQKVEENNNKIVSMAKDNCEQKINREVELYQNEIRQIIKQITEDANEELLEALERLQLQAEEKSKNIEELDRELNELRTQREVINQEILRRKEIEMNEEFYRVQLSPEAKGDIEILQSVLPKLNNRDAFKKLIYDTYISKPAQEMVKRVLKGEAPSGIYKITRLSTGEIYVGRSTSIRDRWLQHLKTAFGVGTIAHSVLHTTMEKDGIDRFTFELLEEVEKEKLGEREKYWINFYDTKRYGLNERAGG